MVAIEAGAAAGWTTGFGAGGGKAVGRVALGSGSVAALPAEEG